MTPGDGKLLSWKRVTIHRVFIDREALLALASGSVTVAGFAPLYFYPTPIFTLALLIWLWGRAGTPKRAAALGWWFGIGFFFTGVSWVYVSLHDFGGMPAPLAGAVTLLFCAYLALFPAVAGYAYAWAGGPLSLRAAVVAPAVWTLTESVRGWLFTGFPWLTIGYSQVPASPLAGYAPIAGVYGVTLATIASAGLLVTLLEGARRMPDKPIASSTSRYVTALRHRGAIILVVIWTGGYALKSVQWTQPAGAPTRVALLQASIPQDVKWAPEGIGAALHVYRTMAMQSDAGLIVLPETAFPLFLDQVPPDYLKALGDHARERGADLLIGIPERSSRGAYYNSVISFGASPSQTYRKAHLVPFGEFIPLRPFLGPIAGALAIPLQDFSRGPLNPKPILVAGQRIAINICYEDAFGAEIIRQLPEATLLVNASNVAWFGRSIAAMQHLQISQTRALETGRYMLRATNTGLTAIINHRGDVMQAVPQFETAALQGTVQGHAGTTPFVRWGNYTATTICVLMIIAAAFLIRGRRRLTPEPRMALECRR